MTHSFQPVKSKSSTIFLESTCANDRAPICCTVSLGIALMLALGILPPRSAAQSTKALQNGAAPPIESSVKFTQPSEQNQSNPPIPLTLQDALERAQKNNAPFLAALADAKIAREDRIQAKVARLPIISYRMDYLGTQGNGGRISDGRFVTNDGVHVYRAWGVIHEELNASTVMGTAYHRAIASEALAQAKVEIAERGLTVTVTTNYYALVVSQRKYVTAQQSLQQAKAFFDRASNMERAGQAAHSDVVKAQIQYEQQEQAFEEAKLTMETTRLNLAVMLFPTLNENFIVVDDLDSARALPPLDEIQSMAARENPNLRVALQANRQADLDVTAAKNAFFPSLVVEPVYGIEANAFALHSVRASFPEAGVVPNLGYFITASVVLPVWDWGTLRSKLHQSQYRQQQVRVELSQTQRELAKNFYAAYNEALVARSATARLRGTADLADESLLLINLRYQAGESTILELVDAQSTLTAARNAYDDAQVRYRVALATLQTLTGSF